MGTIHTRIKEARQAKGLSMEQLAALVGVTYQTVQQWENGKTAPKRKRLAKVAEALGVTVEFLSLGSTPDEDQDHAPIRLVDAKASAGRGEVVMSEDVTKTLMFRRDWLAKQGAKPDTTIAFPVKGSSMVDAHIVNGSVVLANRVDLEPRPRKIYVIWIDGELFVKELVRKGGAWWARSHNAAKAADNPDILIDDPNAHVVGKVFWCGFEL